ncbi:MAG: DUF4388 domain-containing protein [Nitrospirae bacterium]|nr:DUF4388 domain-containing protein [Nitrospirota bacterium]
MINKGLKGNLHGLVIYEILKRINHSNITGVLFVKSGNSIGSIYIKDKQIVYAKYKMANENESLKEIFSLKSGEYNWQENLPPIRETISYFIPEVLYRQLKEAIGSVNINLVSGLPDYNKKLMLSPEFGKFGDNLNFTANELTILDSVKKGATINYLLRSPDIIKDEALKSIYMLYLSDIIDIEENREKKERGTSESVMMDRLKGFGV